MLLAVGLPRALVEALLVAGALISLMLVVVPDLPAARLAEIGFLIGILSAVLCGLRLHILVGTTRERFLREIVGGALVTIGLAALRLASIALTSELSRDQPLVVSFIATLLAANAMAYAITRIGTHAWLDWDLRGPLHWSLTRAQLVVVILAGLLFSALGVSNGVFPDRFGLVAPFAIGTAPASAGVPSYLLHFVAGLLVVALLALAIVLPPAALLANALVRRTTRRIEALSATIRALRNGDLSARVVVEGTDEVARLQTDFNAMAVDLEQAIHGLERERDAGAKLLIARRELIAGVSHELRTPVATLRSYLEATLKNGSAMPREALYSDLEIMLRETLRLQYLIDDFFILVRAEIGSLPMSLQPTNVGPILERTAATVSNSAWQRRRVEVLVDIAPDLPPATVDERRLEQILHNLVNNALRHTPPGGAVLLAASAEHDAVVIQVRDTGEGIAMEDLPLIWEPLYRGQSARKRDSAGSGLGLPLVKEMTESMGGSVGVESVVGLGSTFTIRIPQRSVSA